NCQAKCEKLGCVWENDKCDSIPSSCSISTSKPSGIIGQQTFGCIYGSVQKPRTVENIINEKPREKIIPTAIVLHYTALPTLEESLQNLVTKDLVVQFMVDKDGTIYQLMRDIETQSSGATCANRNSINIEIVGTSENELLQNEEQFQSVKNLVSWLSQQYDIDLLQQKASAPQQGLLGHYEVDLECTISTGKTDPGPLYMAKMRTSLCSRSMFFDMTKDMTKLPTKDELQRNKLAVSKITDVKTNPVHIMFTNMPITSEEVQVISSDIIDPACTIIMQKNGRSVSLYSMPLTCTLRDYEIKDVEEKIIPLVESNLAKGKLPDAVYTTASEISKKINEVMATETSYEQDYFFGDESGSFSPTGCAVCSGESNVNSVMSDDAQQVLSVASKISKDDASAAYKKSLAKYSSGTDPFAGESGVNAGIDFDKLKDGVLEKKFTTQSERIQTWPYYVIPQFFPEKMKMKNRLYDAKNRDFDVSLNPYEANNLKTEDFYVPTFVDLETKNSDFKMSVIPSGAKDCSYEVRSNGKVTKSVFISCGEPVTITVGPGKDCRDEGTDVCHVSFYFNDYGIPSSYLAVFSISFSQKVDCFHTVKSNNKVTKNAATSCGEPVTITVGPGKDCRDEGENACIVSVGFGTKVLHSLGYSITFTKDNICAYEITSYGIITRSDEAPCNSKITISVGQNRDCRDEGENICKIKITDLKTNAEREESSSISFFKRDNVYYFGQNFVTSMPGAWNCHIKVESNGYATRDEKVPCWNGFDSNEAYVSIHPDGDCRDEGENICKITLSNGYIFKSETVHIISVGRFNTPTTILETNTNVNQKIEKLVKAISRAIKTASENKYGVKVSLEEVYTIAIGEGLNSYLLNYYLSSDNNDYKVSGFNALGTDWIGSELTTLKTGGFISQGLEVEQRTSGNERGEIVISGDFKNLDDAMEGVAGTIAYRKYLFFRDLKNLGISPSSISRQQVNYWLYLYYNPGPGFAKQQLRKYVHNGILDDKSYITARHDELLYNGRNGRANALIRAVMIETMYELGMPGYSNVL
ncbi:MAG: peptidoglycan recognition family protein, partial [Candidatus Aenigmatarchaeota archaeon]